MNTEMKPEMKSEFRKTKFKAYTDPGHAWVKVNKKLLARLGIADKITGFSFMRGNYAYLEEDKDLHTFVEAYKAVGGTIVYKPHTSNKRSKIRTYNAYSVEPVMMPPALKVVVVVPKVVEVVAEAKPEVVVEKAEEGETKNGN